jgi:hypothetical protein
MSTLAERLLSNHKERPDKYNWVRNKILLKRCPVTNNMGRPEGLLRGGRLRAE